MLKDNSEKKQKNKCLLYNLIYKAIIFQNVVKPR